MNAFEILFRGDVHGPDDPPVHAGKIPRGAIGPSQDLDRILALPVREHAPELYDELRSVLTVPWGDMRLWDEQCQALLDAMAAGGLFGALAVGKGKTLTACLLPTVLESKCTVILTSASLCAQGERLTEEYAEHFDVQTDIIHWVAYSTLSSQNHADVLEELQPDLIVADECHKLANADSARTKRFRRYAKEHPSTRYAFLSGTVTKRSIRDFAALLELALGDNTPLPQHWPDLSAWSEALDVSDDPRPAGELRRLCRTDETAREGWQRRFRATCGVVASDENEIGCSLIIRETPPPKSPIIEGTIRHVRAEWERPDGDPLMFAMELARVLRQVRLGGYYREVWREDITHHQRVLYVTARRRFRSEVRAFLKRRNREGLDSPGLVEAAIERGELRELEPYFDTWKCVREKVPAPTSEWEWLCREVVHDVVRSIVAPVVVFTDLVEVGQTIARLAGVPYYGAGDRAAREILDEDGSRSIVASIQAHGTGRNLQCFDHAIVAGGTPTGVTWEQLLGRLHRNGQTSDEVTYDVLFGDEVERATADARYIEETIGNRQKLLAATFIQGD